MFKRFAAYLLCVILALDSLLFCACSENEALPAGEVPLEDIDTEHFRDENGVIAWPYEILPDGFPVIDYVEIYSAERKDNIVTVTVFARLDKYELIFPHAFFARDLLENGWFSYELSGSSVTYGKFYNKNNKTEVRIYASAQDQNYYSPHLDTINEHSPTGFTVQFEVQKKELLPESLLWDYPPADADLGLEFIKFDNWPAEYLPKGFVKPESVGMKLESAVQKNNGVFLTVSGGWQSLIKYKSALSAAGYSFIRYSESDEIYVNSKGDYFRINVLDYTIHNDGNMDYVVELQICQSEKSKDTIFE